MGFTLLFCYYIYFNAVGALVRRNSQGLFGGFARKQQADSATYSLSAECRVYRTSTLSGFIACNNARIKVSVPALPRPHHNAW